MAGPVVVVVGRRVEKEAAVRKFLFFLSFSKKLSAGSLVAGASLVSVVGRRFDLTRYANTRLSL